MIIGLTVILLIPTNAIIHAVADTTAVSAALPVIPAIGTDSVEYSVDSDRWTDSI